MRSLRWVVRAGVLVLFILIFAGGGVFAADYCDMARDIAERAAKTFNRDQEKGIKLFIKAHNLCKKPLYAYNLGIAYFEYGNPAEAEKFLAEAVKGDGSRAKWLNDYAGVILLRSGDAKKALQMAEKAWRLASDSSGLKPAIAETLAEAQMRTGQGLVALKGIRSAALSAPSEKRLQTAMQKIESRYIQAALQLVREGKKREGFLVLEKGADFSALTAKTYCLALARDGAGEKALAAAAKFARRYPAELDQVWSEVVAAECDRLYRRFQAGERAQAMQMAKALHEKYDFDKDFKVAYDKLFEAYLADDVTIAVARPQTGKAYGRAASGEVDLELALASAFGEKSESGGENINLGTALDQDKNIRQGKLKRKHGIALVIGNQHYKEHGYGVPDVKYAGRDVAVMKKYLIKTMGFKEDNIITAHDASFSKMRSLLGTPENPKGKLYNYVKAEKGRAEVFVYYVGHGSPSAKSGEAYLVPVEAEVDYLESSAYPLSLFYRNLEFLEAKSVMVVLDACFSGDSAGGTLFKGISPTVLKNVEPVRELKRNSFVLCGAGKNQVCAWYKEKNHSLMTYYFLEALQGRADSNGDDSLSVGEVYEYVQDKVSSKTLRDSTSREQNPKILGNLDLVLAELE
ncbi:MAG: caspase family protein [Pseudomonadota bacterium]|nr:caspase family protein [Pseudomonadota bacterium]